MTQERPSSPSAQITSDDLPDHVATAVEAVERLFAGYERALLADDLVTLEAFFWADATRYGTDGNQHSGIEIAAARRRPHPSLSRDLVGTVIRAAGADVVIAETEFERSGARGWGRQSQVWCRRNGEWRILHAHVSMLPTLDAST